MNQRPILDWLFCLFTFFLISMASAQNEDRIIEDSLIDLGQRKDFTWDMSFELKTMNVFRGLIPSNAPAFSTQAGARYKNFIGGFYGGASFNGVYTETDLILIYYRPKYNVRLDWYYNFTEGITNIPSPSGFFDFTPEKTRGLLDFMITYQINKNLSIHSSTLLYGRDRGVLPEDLINDVPLRRGSQRYSQYLKLTYSWYMEKSKFSAHLGGSFSWDDLDGATFYGDRPGFNDIGVSFSSILIDTPHVTIPVKVATYVNTLSNNVYLVGVLQLKGISRLID
ncbi:hypothetical protein [Robertkochia aurantiaca]|uniref:hypothetical protein n=1 Tax=Robertkochia aurantiaca TaxID=2873700 RepID=UPI001CD03AAA|nr:hypothetical protein [Robertkochia sp. 3YJGBD-33]